MFKLKPDISRSKREKAEKEEISVSDIRSELFESENVVIGKSDNGQSLLVSGPFANK